MAALVGALGAALGGMVVSYSLGKKSLVAHQGLLEDAGRRLVAMREACARLADADAAAYERLNALQRLAPDDPERAMKYAEAVTEAIDVPMRLAVLCEDALRVLRTLAGTSNPHLKSDLAIAGVLALAGAEAARWNVVINLREIGEDQRREELRARVDGVVAGAARLKGALDGLCG